MKLTIATKIISNLFGSPSYKIYKKDYLDSTFCYFTCGDKKFFVLTAQEKTGLIYFLAMEHFHGNNFSCSFEYAEQQKKVWIKRIKKDLSDYIGVGGTETKYSLSGVEYDILSFNLITLYP